MQKVKGTKEKIPFFIRMSSATAHVSVYHKPSCQVTSSVYSNHSFHLLNLAYAFLQLTQNLNPYADVTNDAL